MAMTDGQSQGGTDPSVVTHYWDDDHQMYVKRLNHGYRVAVKNPDGEWEFDSVTEQWSPNPKFYPRSEVVPILQFPEQSVDSGIEQEDER
jgi:hypothetical protein